MDQNVINLPNVPPCLPAKRTNGGGKVKDPDRRADCNMGVSGKVDRDRFDRHFPMVHSVAPAPPEAERSLGAFGRADLVQDRARAVRFFQCFPADISHAGEINHQFCRIGSDVRIIGGVGTKGFLPEKYARRVAGQRLKKSEKEESGRHEVKGEDVKLDADPKHQGHSKDPAEDKPDAAVPKKQDSRCQVGQPVDNQERDTRKGEILKKRLCKGEDLKVRKHGVHSHDSSAWVNQHTGGARDRADSDEQGPENQDFTCSLTA